MPAQPSQNGPDGDGAPPGRADARRNRARILEAAREAYARHGIDVPVATVARRAGVGAATVYRHFPTRDALVTSAFAEELASCVGVLDRALEDPDPWRGFCTLVTEVCAMQAADRGFSGAFLTRFPDAAGIGHERARAEELLTRLVHRAQAAGELRPDFAPSDLTLLFLANNGVTARSPTASPRLVAYLLQSFRTTPDNRPLPPPAPLGLRDLPGGRGA